MRWVICALVVLVPASSAFAQDFDVLRGSQTVGPATFLNWSGFYVGGQFSYSNATADFSKGTQAPIAYALRETGLQNLFAPSTWPVLGTASQPKPAYGGFLGYNSQWQDLIIGAEGTFSHTTFSLVAPTSMISRVTPQTATTAPYLVNISGTAAASNIDYGTLRGRAGWIAGNFLPYGFAGLAIGHGNVNVTANVWGEQNPPSGPVLCGPNDNPPCVPFSFTGTAGKNGEWLLGFAVGGGLDWAVTRNLFLRAEYEYVQFAPIANVVININTARVGAGIKF